MGRQETVNTYFQKLAIQLTLECKQTSLKLQNKKVSKYKSFERKTHENLTRRDDKCDKEVGS